MRKYMIACDYWDYPVKKCWLLSAPLWVPDFLFEVFSKHTGLYFKSFKKAKEYLIKNNLPFNELQYLRTGILDD